MKIEEPKKVNREASKWEEHMGKKPKDSKGGEAEITPGKKKAAAPAKETPKAEKKEHTHSHEGHDHSHEGHDHSHEGHDHSHEHSHEHKAETKTAKAEKPAAKKEKKAKKSRKVIVKKSKEVIAMSAMVLTKSGTPTFRGRFGKRNIRRKSIAKWNVWRVPRGIDVKKSMADGYMPRVGFATPKEIRHVHPSGYREFRIKTISELKNVPKGHAIRVASGLGSRKKVELVDKANEMGVKVLNP